MMVRIETDGQSPITGRGTRVTTLDGAEIVGIRKIEIEISPKAAVAARLELCADFRGVVNAKFGIVHPFTGEFRFVRRIEFEDGPDFVAAREGEAGSDGG